jgi:diguanylate cyclase (GGDEF)-like protein
MQTFDTELKKAYEDLGIAQEQAETGDRRVDVSPPVGAERRGDAERRVDPERRKRIEDMSFTEMRKELLVNPLTGIPNRRAMEEAMQQADDEGAPKTVIFIDADSLKTINDLGGHEAGDALLKSLADAVKTVDPDLGCHISGDEFVILADNPEQAKEKAAKLDEILATKEIVFTLENGDEFTYSGLGASHGIAETLKEADKRMGLHKIAREEAGERVGRGETPPGLRKTASREGEVSVGPGQEKGLLGEEEKVWKGLTLASGKIDTQTARKQVRAGFLAAAGLDLTMTLDNIRNPNIVGAEVVTAFNQYMDQLSKTGSANQPIPEKLGSILAGIYKKVTEKKAAEKKAAEKKAIVEKKVAEKKATEKKAAEKKAVEQEEEKQEYLKNIGIVDRQLKGFEGEVLTGPRKKIHAGLVAERQRYIDQVNKLFPGTVKDDPGVSVAKGEVPEFVALLNKTKSGKVALRWIAKNSKIKSYREIAKRMLFHLPKVSLVIVRNSDQPGVPWQISHSKGLHSLRGEKATVYLKNYGEPQNRGMDELVFLHEMIHAATVAKIRRSIDPALKKSKLRADVKRLDVLHREIIQYLHDPLNSSSGKQLVVYRNWARRLGNTRELVAYGMTDPGFQKILDQIPFERTTVWKKFVKIIADILGVSDHTALGELIRITDELVAADRPPLSTFKDHSGLADEMADTGVEMMTIDDLPPDQKKLFEEAFGTLVKQPAKTQVRRMQEEEQTVLDAAETSRDPSTREVTKKLKKLNRSSTEFKRTEKTQTVGWLDRILGLPEYSFAKDAAANRVMQIALKADEVKYSIQTSVTGNFGKIGERVQKDNSKAYESGKDYLLESDKTGVSFSMAMDKGTWNVVGLAGEILETKLSEADAISAMMDAEQAHLIQQGFSSDAIDFIMEFRGVTNRAFDVQVADLRQQLATAERYGLDEPRVAGEGTPTISEAIATIGDLRGSYFPRERPNRTYIIRASKKGADNVLLTYDGYLPENTESWDITNRIKEVINMGLPISREIKKLQAEGYEVNGPTLSPAPSEAVFDAPGIAASLDAFLNLAETSSKDEDSKAIQHLNRMLVKKIAELYKAKGSLSSRLHRVDDYTTGFETDPLKAALSHAQRVASGVTKRQTARDMILCFTGRDVSFSEYQKTYPGKKYLDYRKFVSDRRVDPTEQQDLYKDVKDYIHYALESNTSADRSLGYLKAAAVFMYLGFRIPSAAVNLTNMVMAVPATIAAHADVSVSTAFKEVATASAVYAAYRSNQLMHHGVSESVLKKVAASAEAMAKKAGKTLTGKVEVTPEDTMVLDDIAIRGWDQAHFNIEALKALQGYSGKTFNSVMSASMYMFGAAEKANRAVTILAAYKALKTKHPEMAHEDLMNQAHHTSDRAHGIYGKAAKPFLVQKYKGLDLFYTFMKFQHNYMLNMLEVGIKYKNLPAALHMLAISAVLSGAGATLATPVIATLAKMFGFSDDPEEDMYAWTEEHLPAIMARMVRHGAFGLLNINFKGSMQMNNPFPTKLREVAGAPGAVIIDVWDMAKHFRHREWSKGLEKGLPTFAETPVKGYRFYTEGVTTKTYSPVFYGKDQLKADELELFMMMFSFNTARLSGLREKQWKEKNVKGSFSKDRQSILRRLKKIKMSSDPSNISALARIQEEIDEFNLRVERAPSRYQINYLTWTQIRQRALRVD